MATICPVAETYATVAPKLDKLVGGFYAKYGVQWVTRFCGPYDDMRSHADEIFLRCYDSYRGNMGAKFSTWLNYRVWRQLLQVLRRALIRHKSRPKHVDLFEEIEERRPKFDLADFLEALDDDGRKVVRVAVVKTPVGVRKRVEGKGRETPNRFRVALKGYFISEEGWTRKRFASAKLGIRNELTKGD